MNISRKQLLIGLSAVSMLSLVACQSMEQGTGQKASATLDG
jgi:Cu-Zn family superoxide dismutase